MDQTEHRYAYRCLPLTIANQWGWWLLSPQTVIAIWTGDPSRDGIRILQQDGSGPCLARSHFGSGILTWQIPYVFRTPRGWDLLLRGPTNVPKDGIAPLEGIVESTWSPTSATMNWIFTRPGPVAWMQGEPIAMIVPQRHDQLEGWEPEMRALDSDRRLGEAYRRWSEARDAFNGSPGRRPEDWQRHYHRGEVQGWRASPGAHRTGLRLPGFRAPAGSSGEPAGETEEGGGQ
jgi:hypothetical protein